MLTGWWATYYTVRPWQSADIHAGCLVALYAPMAWDPPGRDGAAAPIDSQDQVDGTSASCLTGSWRSPWVRAITAGQSMKRARSFPYVCISLDLLTRCMRPEGPWQRLAAALADSSAFST